MEDFDIGSIVDGESEGDSIEIESPSGNPLTVLTVDEADLYNRMATRYQADNAFTNISDLSELDRILAMELMSYRWAQWMIKGTDYDNKPVDPRDLQRYIESYSKEIRGIKKDLGMDKSSRDKDKETSIAEYLAKLSLRAKEFGVVRNEQAATAITLLKELQGIITLYDNSTDHERREFNCNIDDILEWIRGSFDKFDELDEHLRKEQRLWIRTI